MAACFRYHKGKFQILTVFYNDWNSTYQLRLPGGTVKFEDICNAIKKCIPSINKVYHEKLEFAVRRIEEYEASCLKALTPEIKKDFIARNKLLNSYLKTAYDLLDNTGPPKDVLEKIAEEARLIAMLREVSEETLGTLKGKLIKFSSSFLGSHEKLGFVTFDMLAPDFWDSSPDTDILCSQWMDVSEAMKQLYDSNGSSHRVLTQSAIKKAIELKLHPKVEELRIYAGENN